MNTKTNWILFGAMILVITAFLLPTFQTAVAQDNASGEASALKLVGLTVAQRDPDSKYDQSLIIGADPGVKLFFRYVAPKGMTILGLDRNESRVTSIVDSTGKDLSKVQRESRGRKYTKKAEIDLFPRLNKEKTAAVIGLQAPVLPAAGASSITVTGEVKLKLATGIKEETVKDVALKADGVLKFPKVIMTIKKTEIKKDWSKKDGLAIELTFEGKRDFIKSLSFIDAAGKEIKASKRGSSSMGMGGKSTSSINYFLSGKPEAATVKLTYFDGMKEVTLPIKAKAGLGL